ncbi:uncharacterized protein LACBIDRAFT_295136 [Laccaria bicolor S238N-H82]|uniref:Predicted protein n=1 Tax=Laccaria bicolor (strain S238N-H82 / ATCC MYA-4686) TaxID=486041 RepID=B0DMW6_LACBS|nr:uncharacterized protein LACBIDRAFT_295136 [Laccaria bicolor S238N-H82]EDR04044.1 predicted protein [Laccaria bicolor S238N-H82]|eukprot:XP_001885299.1 predicted protein [Laccaria bicolor S238N-H82]
MATAANSYYFRRRTMGRAASPPTWACYEQIRYDDEDYSDSCSDSCSEDEEDYSGSAAAADSGVRQSRGDMSDDAEDVVVHPTTTQDNSSDIDMDMGDGDEAKKHQKDQIQQKDVKGKQRAIEPEPESPRRQRKKKQQVYTLRPILTIQRSQGFVWNQDLFVPPYIKDRYVASTSPPNSRGFISTSASSTNSALTDYEVEVVEIRVQEGDLDDIIP